MTQPDPPRSDAEKQRLEQEAMNAYYRRDPEALLRLIKRILEEKPCSPS